MSIIETSISIVLFGMTTIPLALVIDMIKNNDRSPSIFLFVLQFGISAYFGLWFFLKSIGFV